METKEKAWQPSRILFTARESSHGRRMRILIEDVTGFQEDKWMPSGIMSCDLCLREYRLFLRLCWARVVGIDVDKSVDDGWIQRDELFPGKEHYCSKVLWNIRQRIKHPDYDAGIPWPVYEKDLYCRVRLLAEPGAVAVDPDLLKAGDEEIRIMAVRIPIYFEVHGPSDSSPYKKTFTEKGL